MKYDSASGGLIVTDSFLAPDGTVLLGSDTGLTAAAGGIDAALAAGEYSVIDVTLSQAAVGAGAEYNTVYLVFNSSDPTTDLANPAVRRELHLQNGIGETRRYTFSSDAPLTSMDYNPAATSANIKLNWEYKA